LPQNSFYKLSAVQLSDYDLQTFRLADYKQAIANNYCNPALQVFPAVPEYLQCRYFLKSGNTGIALITFVAALGSSWLRPTDYSANPHPLPWFQIILLVVAVINDIR
jgi:hypothetical protein